MKKVFIQILLVVFYFNTFANGDTYINLDSCKFCIKAIKAVQFTIIKNKLHFTPIVAWNNYDKTQIGIAFYSKPQFKNIDYVFLPMFGIGSKNLTGIANFKYTLSIKKLHNISFGFNSKRFSYLVFPEDLAYNKIEPFIKFSFKENKKQHKSTIGFKSSLMFLEFIYYGRNTEFYYINNLFYKYDFNKKKNNAWFKIDFKQAEKFTLMSGEFNTQINYNTKKNNAFYLRVFAGVFLYYIRENPRTIPTAPIAKFLLSANNNKNLGNNNSAFTQYQKDYTFDSYFFDRNSNDVFFSKQIAPHSDGGFKTLSNIGNSNKYLLALNLKSDIPIPFPIDAWVNVAMIEKLTKPDFVAEAGISLNFFNKFIQFHFPIITTKNLSSQAFSKKTSFSINLMKLDDLRRL